MRTTLLAALAAILSCATAAAAEPDGAALFMNHCAACHGTTGEGDGPVAGLMSITVPNLRTLARRSGGELPEDRIAAYIDGRAPNQAHGGRQMPIWGDVFRVSQAGDEEVVAARIKVLVWFISELQYR
jgi:mono/diheme cytochrome c family protein